MCETRFLCSSVADEVINLEDGFLRVPGVPGIGVETREAGIEACRVRAR
jgi:hypothetical protein